MSEWAFTTRRFWYERGRMMKAPHWWIKLGPFVFEFHLDRYAVGVVASRWYVGVLAGPFVFTVGQRAWIERERWQFGADHITVTTDVVPRPDTSDSVAAEVKP